MGTLVLDSTNMTLEYGILSVRFNNLRKLYNCVRDQVNAGMSPEECFAN